MDAPSDGLTADSTMVGTLRYAAPERLAGGEVTPRSDVWALGAVLYEMLTGVPAVTASDPVGALAASQAAPDDARWRAAVPGFGHRSGDGDGPADRYPDAVALRDALAADGAPVDPNAMTAVVPIVGHVDCRRGAGAAPRRWTLLRRPMWNRCPAAALASTASGYRRSPIAASRIHATRHPDCGSRAGGRGASSLAGTSLLAGGTDGGTGYPARRPPRSRPHRDPCRLRSPLPRSRLLSPSRAEARARTSRRARTSDAPFRAVGYGCAGASTSASSTVHSTVTSRT